MTNRVIRRRSICEMRNEPIPQKRVLGVMDVSGSAEEIRQHSITIAMSRDPRRNTRVSAELAMQIAERNPEMSVVYLNTYAGGELMREAFNLTHPPLTPPAAAGGEQESDFPSAAAGGGQESYSPPAAAGGGQESYSSPAAAGGGQESYFPSAAAGGGQESYSSPAAAGGGQESYSPPAAAGGEQESYFPSAAAGGGQESYSPPAAAGGAGGGCVELPNLHIIDIPFDAWDLRQILRSLKPKEDNYFYAPGDAPAAQESPLEKPLVVILNDFELAGFTAWQRRNVVRDLVGFQEQLDATVIVFSHEMREDIRAGLTGRGALGLLALKAEAVHRIATEFDHLVKTRKPSKNADVHEAQTQLSESSDEYKLTRNSLEAAVDLFQIPIISSRFGQPLPTPPLLTV